MGFMDAVTAYFSNYVVFSDRSRRAEYWWPQLFILIVGIVLAVLAGVLGETIGGIIGVVSLIFHLAVIIPAIAVSVRRLHDHDKSGWWLLIA